MGHFPMIKIIGNNAKEIVHMTRQAIELYKASQTVSLYAKPVLLYYSYTRLARVLFLATYEQNTTHKVAHGLKMVSNDVSCLKAGAFARFQDSVNPDPSIYLQGHVFGWHSLLEPPTDRFKLFEIN